MDDEPDLLQLFKQGLQYFGFEVDAYSSSEIALGKYKRNHYDLLLLDIKMEDMNGIGLLNEILKKNENVLKGKEKVCFLTASNFNLGKYSFYHKDFDKIIDKEIRESVKENPDKYIIQKPISLKELASRLYYVICS